MGNSDDIEKLTVPALVIVIGLLMWGALEATCAAAVKVDGMVKVASQTYKVGG